MLNFGHFISRMEQIDIHGCGGGRAAEKRHLSSGGRFVGAATVADDAVERVHKLGGRSPTVEHAGFDHEL